jgi:hypothetical protein
MHTTMCSDAVGIFTPVADSSVHPVIHAMSQAAAVILCHFMSFTEVKDKNSMPFSTDLVFRSTGGLSVGT